jgi:hypothetical protein
VAFLFRNVFSLLLGTTKQPAYMKKITIFCLLFCYGLMQAQPVSGYLFSQSAEAYLAVSGTNSAAIGDDGTEDGIAIGFPFYFGGTTYTTFSISTNGFIRLGTAIGGGNWINALSNACPQAPIIAAFWDDNNRNGGAIQYQLSGVSPNQMLEVGWNQVNIGNNGQPNNTVSASYKIRLHESGVIEMIYGPQMDWSGGITASIGINDLTSFMSVTPAAGGATVSSATANNVILATTAVVSNKYVFTPPVSCSGTPAPGNTVASTAAICAGHDLTLTVENVVNEPGVSYQWQSSTDGVIFADIQDATTAEINVTQTVETTYQCVVTCAFGSEATSTPLTVAMSVVNCYCIPTYTFGKADGDLISNIVITGTTLSNNTGTAALNPAYTYFTGQPNYTATLEAGTSYEIQVTVGSFGQQNSAVWIDYNDDQVFSEEERLGYTTAQTDSFGTAIYTIQLGCNAPAGLHRMRVRDVWNTAGITIDPCANYGYGETEDYDITIAAQSVCPVATGLNAAEIGAYAVLLEWNTGCGQASWDVFVTPAGTAPGTATHLNVTSPLIVENLTTSTDYEFYVLAHCDLIGDSVWAGPFAFTTAPEPVENDECDTAFVLNVGAVFEDEDIISTNSGATNSLSQATPGCAAFNFGGDVWYSMTVPANGILIVETRAESGSPVTDTGLALYSGSCGALTELTCSDDEGEGAFSYIMLADRTPGETIYARVWEYANDAHGPFKLGAWYSWLGTESFNDAGLSYYPNPVKENLNVSYVDAISDIIVYNLLGQKMLVQKVSTNNTQVDLSALAAGTYMVKVLSGNLTKTITVIKE